MLYYAVFGIFSQDSKHSGEHYESKTWDQLPTQPTIRPSKTAGKGLAVRDSNRGLENLLRAKLLPQLQMHRLQRHACQRTSGFPSRLRCRSLGNWRRIPERGFGIESVVLQDYGELVLPGRN